MFLNCKTHSNHIIFTMGRKKLPLQLIENPVLRQVKFSKRKSGILKKASELSILCDTDVGLVMFSCTGQLASYASNGRSVQNNKDICVTSV